MPPTQPAFVDLTIRLEDYRLRLVAGDEPVEAVLMGLLNTLDSVKRQNPVHWGDGGRLSRAPPRTLLLEDPLTRWANERPRGYPGDAVMMDAFYTRDHSGLCALPPTPLGKRIFRFTVDQPEGEAIRVRRVQLAAMIDETCRRVPGAKIMSLACGHMREAHDAEAVRTRSFGRFLGIDHDPRTVELVQRELGHLGVEATKGSVKTVLAPSFAEKESSGFDLIYVSGLYDYLVETTAAALTMRLFSLLRPGGHLLVGNCARGRLATASQEAFMNWPLIYRDLPEMRRHRG